MKRALKIRIILAHALMIALVAVIALAPHARRNVADPLAFYVAVGVIEALYLVALFSGRKKDPFPQGSTDITLLVWTRSRRRP